jgi:hypothetical protein
MPSDCYSKRPGRSCSTNAVGRRLGRDKTPCPNEKCVLCPNDQNFSKTIKGHSSEYGPVNAWLKFQREILGFTKRKDYILVTDISNYYDSIGHDHLRNNISGYVSLKEQALDLMVHTLSHMLWQPDYMPRVAIGLPQMNLDAPRLLAHSFLFEIDEFVSHDKSIEYARYMDDIDMGVDSLSAAKRALRDLDLALQTRQIRLNSGKTQILTSEQAKNHFRIRENRIISKVYDLIATRSKSGSGAQKEKKWIQISIRKGLMKRSFSTGSGPKILKRLINISREFSIEIGDDEFDLILNNFADLRTNILNWWQNTDPSESKLTIAMKYLEKNAVDHLSIIQLAVSLVNMRIKRSATKDKILKDIIDKIKVAEPWHIYSKLWLLSKFGKSSEIMILIESNVPLWVSHEPLGRLVGAMYPRLATAHVTKLKNIIEIESATVTRTVLDFHERLASNLHSYTSVAKFIKAPNGSLPNAISHPKFLMLCSALTNHHVAPTASSALRKIHALALSDEFYATIAP